ncbi:MAG: hypothetical protein BMS9Abin17_1548 [Acidimicrobiia bacterium]|nr:MAG: hypothetical protein BMS9Abin17_1548 [Acidimicrobiia bacterium]
MRTLKRLFFLSLALVGLGWIAGLAVRKLVPAYGSESDDEFSVVAGASGSEFQSRASSLREGRVLAVMGGVELDLTDAGIDAGATLDVKTVMGGVDVIVPPQWRVELISNSVFGGVSNRTDPDSGGADAPLLLVRAQAIMGGIEIHATESV